VEDYLLGLSQAAQSCHRHVLLVPLIIVLILAACFAIYCEVDVIRARRVRYLPRWLWGIICLISIPLGGIIYLAVGKER
jgi:Phospholipase_D-nuclease N-terminal